jgi:hypothetical protein
MDTIGDGPVGTYPTQISDLARFINEYFNGDAKGEARETGFVLLVFPFGNKEGRCNYISNGAAREDLKTLFREQIARFDGSPET